MKFQQADQSATDARGACQRARCPFFTYAARILIPSPAPVPAGRRL